ncbi:SDR family NAD(P)-dependent oxidoreductase [Kribbella sandramycini]|uniref:NAD(P)-dependent dehydrogenase (Short-subunit alcohol dehydrogenase family) n=1 Tax=Kribbella sandramycini TaxID=60450 RepID=A0A7Y4P245_9ACTN|nr:SDR family NAD(P)-dependent oxidoreductase [Kribbella sandramycini]MBB6571778.1 NAD(P)-dependent dehydrogenase (short-subunit alcohol dehydrogenase family) [Kribbella sandramycini]NOL44421.1 SDR family NAD(P)-dependent oxidoreductase [Kribbella sandramycini]
MRNVLVAGGTTGLGREIAVHYLRRGARVTVVGSTPERGRAFLDDVAALPGEAAFVAADLTSLAENRRVIEEARSRHQALDALVLTAMVPFVKRKVTVDGFEAGFVLYYLSRFLLSYGLTDLLERGATPIIANIGATGITKGAVAWDDLHSARKYSLVHTTIANGRANDLLPIHYLQNHPDGRTKYFGIQPPYTNTPGNHLPQPLRALSRLTAAAFAKSPADGARDTLAVMDDQPAERLILRAVGKPVDPGLPTFDPANARRLYELTAPMLESVRR